MKLLKRIALIFSILILVLFVLSSALYLYYNESEPKGIASPKADELAQKMLESINIAAWDSTRWVRWTFRGANHYVWNKETHLVQVEWENNKVLLHTQSSKAQAFVDQKLQSGEEAAKLIRSAKIMFNNDSFWLNAPTKAIDPGTERSIVKTKEGKEALKVKYHSGGDTPGDAYLWHLDNLYRPTAYQMWVKIIPIGGIEASWGGWKPISTGALVATKHELMGRESDIIGNVSGGMRLADIQLTTNPFANFE